MVRIRHIARPWFIVLLLIALSHQIAQWILQIHIPWVDSYLDPLLMMPITLHIILWERRLVFGRGVSFTLNNYQLLAYFLVVSFLAEIVFPMIRPGFVSDFWDVICYGIGTILFAVCWNKPLQRSLS